MALRDKVMKKEVPAHIAIIMDGNGRWAKRRGRGRSYGHEQGALNIKNIALEAHELGVNVLSVYAFSTENWKRPKKEIDFLMQLPKRFEEKYKDDFREKDIRVVFSGRRDRIGEENKTFMEETEEKTKNRNGLILNICFDYGGQTEMLHSMKQIASDVKKGVLEIDDITLDTIENNLYHPELPPVDLMIRTSGATRISNFMLWELSYAEFYFTKTHWPAFNEKHLQKALLNYQQRDRKFGGLLKKKG